MWNTTAFSEKRSKRRSQRSMQKYQYFEWGSTLNLDDVQSQRNVYCYYNNVLLIPSPESPDDFATDVLVIIDWSMYIYDFCSDWSISSMDTAVVSLYPIEWLNFKVYLTGGNWQKWKRVFLTCHCHENRNEAVGLKSCKNTWKITIFVKMWNLGQYRENLIFCQ